MSTLPSLNTSLHLHIPCQLKQQGAHVVPNYVTKHEKDLKTEVMRFKQLPARIFRYISSDKKAFIFVVYTCLELVLSATPIHVKFEESEQW